MVQRRAAETGVYFFRYSATTGNGPSLENERLQTALRKITGSNQTIVTGANNRNVIGHNQLKIRVICG